MIERLKVAFVGTSCTGKTTLVDNYRGRNVPGLVIVEEAAREYFTKNPEIRDRFSINAQGEVQALALKNEQSAHDSGATKIVCDRSVLDAVAYVRSQGDIRGSRRLLDRVRYWVSTYNKLLLVNPADVPYQTDSVRQEDEQVRLGFHKAFLEMFDDAGIQYELLSGTLKQRVKRTDQLLQL
ncbi:MAG: Uncharacterized protein G01um10145_743 [Microgenomates group bacterium Gr01-1014_5]|nr:MAG: Uncharacterized protein G01um10145_743 [Microgenomates group bacterium Gr01-1014_5]